jgi:hypothetical protein
MTNEILLGQRILEDFFNEWASSELDPSTFIDASPDSFVTIEGSFTYEQLLPFMINALIFNSVITSDKDDGLIAEEL